MTQGILREKSPHESLQFYRLKEPPEVSIYPKLGFSIIPNLWKNKIVTFSLHLNLRRSLRNSHLLSSLDLGCHFLQSFHPNHLRCNFQNSFVRNLFRITFPMPKLTSSKPSVIYEDNYSILSSKNRSHTAACFRNFGVKTTTFRCIEQELLNKSWGQMN